jgi:ABC-type Na+ efflux pump permease subunit
MDTIRKNWLDSAYNALMIAAKDIVDALKNKNTRLNIIVIIAMVGFFHWSLTLRPFDKNIDIVVYDQGGSGLVFESATLNDGQEIFFEKVDSIEAMSREMAYEDLGLVIPAGFEDNLKSPEGTTISGYILWAKRNQAKTLEARFSAALSAYFGGVVDVSLGDHLILPVADNLGDVWNFTAQQLFIICWLAIAIVPHLMLEERKTQTLEALLVSPAGASEVVAGKALAGTFYLAIAIGFSMALSWMYVIQWSMAIFALLALTLFAIGLALALGSFIRSQAHLSLWGLTSIFVLILPAFFAHEPFLAPTIRAVVAWLPTTALGNLLAYSFSTGATSGMVLRDLTLGVAGIVLAYGFVIWQVRRLSR